MARNKYPEETINLILDVSLQLFLEKGYEQTTIQDIVNGLGGLSRGAIYHHFKSKEDIINAVTTRIHNSVNLSAKAHQASNKNGLQKLKQLVYDSVSNSAQIFLYHATASMMKNPKFLAQQLNESVLYAAPLLREFIEEGIQDGSIPPLYAKPMSETITLLFNVWLLPAVFPVTREEFNEKLLFIKLLLENMGVPLLDEENIAVFQNYYITISSGGSPKV